MGLVTQLQGQVAQLTAAKEELHKASRRAQASRKAPGGSVLQGWAKQQTQASRPQAGYGVVQLPKVAVSDEVTEPLVEVAVAEDTCPRMWRQTRA